MRNSTNTSAISIFLFDKHATTMHQGVSSIKFAHKLEMFSVYGACCLWLTLLRSVLDMPVCTSAKNSFYSHICCTSSFLFLRRNLVRSIFPTAYIDRLHTFNAASGILNAGIFHSDGKSGCMLISPAQQYKYLAEDMFRELSANQRMSDEWDKTGFSRHVSDFLSINTNHVPRCPIHSFHPSVKPKAVIDGSKEAPKHSDICHKRRRQIES